MTIQFIYVDVTFCVLNLSSMRGVSSWKIFLLSTTIIACEYFECDLLRVDEVEEKNIGRIYELR